MSGPPRKGKRCPNCGYLMTSAWVDAQKFWAKIEKYVEPGKPGRRGEPCRFNDLEIHHRDPDRELLYKLGQGKKLMRSTTAERLLNRAGLDPRLPEEIYYQDETPVQD